MATRFDPAQRLAASLDNPPDISVETLVAKFLLRWKLFLACALIVPLIAVGLAALVPTVYKATAQVLIRHVGGAVSLSGDAAPLLSSLSGPTTAELLRSGPVAARMIKSVGVADSDIPRPAFKVLFGRAATLMMPLFGGESEDPRMKADPEARYRILADDLKPAIDATTLLVDRTGGTLHDELVEVTLKANSREKVAAMVNGLCDSLVAESNQQAKVELLAANKTLGEQAAAIEAELERHRQSAPGSVNPFQFERAADASNEPLAAGLARSISELDVQLENLRQSYPDSAPEVMRVRGEVAQAEARLADQQATDAAIEQLATIKNTQHHLLLGAMLADSGQGGLSVVERALTPKRSKLAQLLRFGIPAAGGLVGGIFIGGLAVVLINLVDPRLFIASDVTPVSGLKLLGTIPAPGLPIPEARRWADLPHPASRPALYQVLGRRDALGGETSRVLAVTSAENESDTATVALQLAALLASDGSGKVLLVDANFERPSLTAAAGVNSEAGLAEIANGSLLAAAVRPTALARLGFDGTGFLDRADRIGLTGEGWKRLFAAMAQDDTTIVVHLPGLLNSREAAGLAKSADQVLVVTARRRSRKPALEAAAGLLAELHARVLGVVHCEA